MGFGILGFPVIACMGSGYGMLWCVSERKDLVCLCRRLLVVREVSDGLMDKWVFPAWDCHSSAFVTSALLLFERYVGSGGTFTGGRAFS